MTAAGIGGDARVPQELRPGQMSVLVLGRVIMGELIREAVRRGWLRHWHHDQRTSEGEELARQLRAFRSELRRLRAEQGEDVLARDWLSYALHFGLVSCDRIPLARFARSWVGAFRGLESWSHTEPRPRRPDEEISFPKDEWRGMSLDLAAAWDMGL